MKLTVQQVAFLTAVSKSNGAMPKAHHTLPKWAKKNGFINTLVDQHSVGTGEVAVTLTAAGEKAIGIVKPVNTKALEAKAKATANVEPGTTFPKKTPKAKKAPKVKPAFTPLQEEVLKALYLESSGNGHDFGLLEMALLEKPDSMTVFQFGAGVSTLVEKKTIFKGPIEKVTVNGTKKYKQYVLTPYAKNAADALLNGEG